MIYTPILEKPTTNFTEATITQLYYIINTVGLLELFIKLDLIDHINFRKKNKKPDVIYTNADTLNEGDRFLIESKMVNGKLTEYWYRTKENSSSKKPYPINGIPEECPVCKSKIAIIKGKAYCNNNSCPGVLFTNIKRFLVLATGLDWTLSEYSVLKKLIFTDKVKCVSDLYHLNLNELKSVWYYENKADGNAEDFYNKLQSTLHNVNIANYLYSLPFFKEKENYNIYISSTHISKLGTMSKFLTWLSNIEKVINETDDVRVFTELESKISQEFYELLVDYFSIEDNVQEALYLEEIGLFK